MMEGGRGYEPKGSVDMSCSGDSLMQEPAHRLQIHFAALGSTSSIYICPSENVVLLIFTSRLSLKN